MKSRLSARYGTAFVTGASGGLGLAFARMLRSEGVRVWGTSRDLGRIRSAWPEEDAGFRPVGLDLARPQAAEDAFEAAWEESDGGFDLVINNAGYGVFGDFAAVPFSRWQEQIDAMIGTTFRLAHAAWRRMLRRNRGCLVNVTSLAVEFPLPFMSGYNAAKAALAALSESLLVEARGRELRVIEFRAGDYRTDFNRRMRESGLASPDGSPAEAAWRGLEKHLAEGPAPEKAAGDLRRALLKGRQGPVRSGAFFQARLAPLLTRMVPASVARRATARYFGAP